MKTLLRCNLIFITSIMISFFSMNIAGHDVTAETKKLGSRPPDNSCSLPPLMTWTFQEKWVWQKICEGEIADLAEEFQGSYNTETSEGWQQSQIISPEFLASILSFEPYVSTLTRSGIEIQGAWVVKPLDLSNISLPRKIRIEYSRFEDEVDFSGLKSASALSLDGSFFNKLLNFELAQIASHVSMKKGRFDHVRFTGADVGGTLYMESSRFDGILDMASLNVNGHIFMRNSEFAEVILHCAKVSGEVVMNGSIFKNKLNMTSVKIENSILINGQAEFKDDVSLISSKIESDLDISNSNFKSLTLTGTKIGGQISLGSMKKAATKWALPAKLSLCNVKVMALQDRPDSWPTSVNLDGFAYDNITNIVSHRVSDFKNWLEKSNFSPQPYRQLAMV